MWGRWTTRRVTMEYPLGLHARPSLAVTQTVARFDAEVRLRCEDRQADGSSILDLLSLDVAPGNELVLQAKGPDAEKVLDALVRLIQEGFGLTGELQPGH